MSCLSVGMNIHSTVSMNQVLTCGTPIAHDTALALPSMAGDVGRVVIISAGTHTQASAPHAYSTQEGAS